MAASSASRSEGSDRDRCNAASLSLLASTGSSSTVSTAAASAPGSPGDTSSAASSPARSGMPPAREQRLLHDQRLPLPDAGQHDDVGRGQQGGDIVAVAEEPGPDAGRLGP